MISSCIYRKCQHQAAKRKMYHNVWYFFLVFQIIQVSGKRLFNQKRCYERDGENNASGNHGGIGK